MPFDFSVMSELPSSAELDGQPGSPDALAYERFRCGLIEAVRTGQLTPADAEKKLKDMRGKPLEVNFALPNNPPELASWTPEMVAAWISSKDLRSVLRHHEECYRGKSIWVENANIHRFPEDRPPFLRERRRGHALIKLDRTSLFTPGYYFNGSRFDYSDLKWFKRLRELLIDGKLVKAWGTEISSGYIVPIAPEDWQVLHFAPDDNNNAVLKSRNITLYRNVTFLAREIRHHFPIHGGFTQERVVIGDVRRWKTTIEKQPKGNRLKLYIVLRAKYPNGFPLTFKSDQDRLGAVRALFGDNDWHEDDDSFKRYLNRFLRDYCEN